MKAIQFKEENLSLWKNKNFLLLWGGNVISSLGLQMYTIAIPLLIYEMSQSAIAMSAMRAVEFLPNIFIGMIAGVLVDRINRKKMMQCTSLIQFISIFAIIVLLLVNHLALWHLYIFGFILSSAGYTFGNANHSIIPQIVAKEQLTSANAKLSFVNTIIQTAGPGLAGALLALVSFTSTLSVYLVCLLLLFFCVQNIQLPTVAKEKPKNKGFWQDMKEGIAALLQNKTLLTPTVTVLFVNLASSLIIGVLIFYVTDKLGATEMQIGLMFTISAVGGLLGASVVSQIRKRFGRGNIYTFCLLFDVVGVSCLIFAPSWWTAGIALGIRTFSTTISNIIYFTIRQEFTPNHLLGRVAGTSSMLMKLTLPFGLLLAGLWAEWLPIPILFAISAAIFLILFICLYIHPFRKLV